MGLRDRFKSAGMFPDVGKIQGEMNAKFDELRAILLEIRDVLVQIRDKGAA